MTRNSAATLVLPAGIGLAVGAGCASEPSTADLMRAHATEMQTQVDLKQQLAKDWEAGRKLIATGEKRVKSGEKRIEKAERELKQGREQLEQGAREIAEGNLLVQESERRFREAFPGLELQSAR